MDEKFCGPLMIHVVDNGWAVPANTNIDEDSEEFQKRLCNRIGVTLLNYSLGKVLEFLFAETLPITPVNERRINFVLAVLDSFEPKNITESMIIVQMCLCHEQSLKLFEQTLTKSYDEEGERLTNMALKLTRQFNTSAETLAKIRRGGKQKMVVEHVNIEQGAQAIVGTVEQGGK